VWQAVAGCHLSGSAERPCAVSFAQGAGLHEGNNGLRLIERERQGAGRDRRPPGNRPATVSSVAPVRLLSINLGTFAALRHRNFQHFTWGQIVNVAGTRINEVAAGWLMWQLTGSATWVGVLAVAEMAPRLLLWPFAGALADRIDRRKLAIASQSLAGLNAFCLAAFSAAGVLSVGWLLLFTAIFGMNAAFWQPIRFSVIPRLVTRDAVASAVALTSVIANIGRVVGPMIAGPVIVWGSVTLAFGLNALSFSGVVIAFWLMRLAPERPASGRPKFALRDLSGGISTIVGNPGVRALLIFIGIFAICVRPVAELLPVLVETVLGAGPAGLASLISAMGVGSLFSGLVASIGQSQRRLVTMLALAGMLGSIMTAALVYSTDLGFALAFIALMGFGVTLKNILAQILLQLTLTDDVRGRVFSVYGMLFGCTPGIGALAMGWAADLVGIALPVLIGAVIGLAISTTIFLNRRRLATLLEPPAEARS
jgi:MFS family permease